VLIRPHCPDGLEWARGEHDSPHGTVRSGWRRENGRLVLEVELPPNTTARVHLPAGDLVTVTESGNPLAQVTGLQVLDPEQGRPVIEIGSGAYRFTMAAC
jgi:alpha-L-rhamnosidase